MKHTLLLGSDTSSKDQAIAQIKSKLFSIPEEAQFDCDTVDANKISPSVFKQSLMSLPAIAKQRLIIIRNLKKLNAANQKILFTFLEESSTNAVCIFDAEGMEATAALVKKLKPFVQVSGQAAAKAKNIFDVTNALGYRKKSKALEELNELLDAGNHPLQLLGGLTWFWGKQKSKVSRATFKKGLLEIQEADIHIKRSRMQPNYAVETLVMKLAILLDS